MQTYSQIFIFFNKIMSAINYLLCLQFILLCLHLNIPAFLVDIIADLVKYLSSLYDQEEGLKKNNNHAKKMSYLHFRPIIRVI